MRRFGARRTLFRFRGNPIDQYYAGLIGRYGGVALPTQDAAGTVTIAAINSILGAIPANSLTATNVTVALAQPTGTPLGYAGLWDGTNDYFNWLSANLATFFNGSAGTLNAFAKVANAAFWTDGKQHYIFRFVTDTGDLINIFKHSTNNQMSAYFTSGGVGLTRNVGSFSPTTWQMYTLTWDKAADAAIFYINGVKQGATLSGFGVWGGTFTRILIGASEITPGNPWSGLMTRFLLLRGAATATEIVRLYQLAGI